jgi:hypothetical protein
MAGLVPAILLLISQPLDLAKAGPSSLYERLNTGETLYSNHQEVRSEKWLGS